MWTPAQTSLIKNPEKYAQLFRSLGLHCLAGIYALKHAKCSRLDLDLPTSSDAFLFFLRQAATAL